MGGSLAKVRDSRHCSRLWPVGGAGRKACWPSTIPSPSGVFGKSQALDLIPQGLEVV